jgi:UDP-N-acetyl-D-mannosaminuronic acid dehydrogenase
MLERAVPPWKHQRMPEQEFQDLDLCIVGGCGHVGLPLALRFAAAGCRVGIYDTDEAKVDLVQAGKMPFLETGADALLAEALAADRLELSTGPAIVKKASAVVLVVGTPIDEFLNPETRTFSSVVEELAEWLADDALLVLRSTVYPGTSEWVAHELASRERPARVVCCPERVAEGKSIEELTSLPQIVGADDEESRRRAAELFGRLPVEMVFTSTREAELAKLFTNAWRYMKFAVANQFFMIAQEAGVDYERLLHAVRDGYPRAADLPGPGFAAGPCLLKDTMQLSAYTGNVFVLGHGAMLVNEGMPEFLVRQLQADTDLRSSTVAILGMAFKAESDDVRASLSYKLRKRLGFAGARVLCSDPYVDDPGLVDLDTALAEADIVVIGAPHACYRDLDLSGRRVVDIWGITGPISV